MPPINSRRKGSSREREAAQILARVTGLRWRRTQQVRGTQDSPDLECLDAPDLAVECKARQQRNVAGALERAVEESGDRLPLLVHRANRSPWLLTLRVEDLPRLLGVLRR